MSKRNNLHSFTLWPKASDHVANTKRGKKSQMVSKAIEWFNKPQDFIVKDYEYQSTAGGEGWPGDQEPGVRTYQRKIRTLDLSELVEANEQLPFLLGRTESNSGTRLVPYSGVFKFLE